jgi:hypothetical protein
MLSLVVKDSAGDESSEFTFSTPSSKVSPRVTFKSAEEAIDQVIPADYFIKLNTDVEE